MRRPAYIVLLAALHFVAPAGVTAQASPYVPVLDQAYADLDVLVLAGWVHEIIQAQRPYSRMGFARFVNEARAGRGDAGPGVVKARFHEALDRLRRRFSAEIESLCSAGAEDCVEGEPYAALREVSADVTLADSPPRDIPTRYGGSDADYIDAAINPLLQRNQGRILADGWTGGAEGILDLTMGPRVAAQVRPRVWIGEGADGEAEPDVTLLQGYVRTVFGKMALEIGRNQVPHGAGRGTGPVLSTNARGMDMVRLSMERPARLPWIFRHLGPFGFSGYVADMGRDQDTPGSKLIVFESTIRPHPNLELGGTLLNHQGGEGAPEATWDQRLADILLVMARRPFYWGPPDLQFSDKAMSFDLRLTFPGQAAEFYVEMMTTDDHDAFAAPREALWTEAAWLVGFRKAGLGTAGRFDVWAEAHHTGVRPYTHHQFTSGITLDGRVLGSPLGPLGTSFTGGLDWVGKDQVVSLSGFWERYQGDTYGNPNDDGLVRFHRLQDNPDEIRLRTTLGWTRYPEAAGMRTTVRLGYEHVTRFNFTDENRTNFLAQVKVGYVW